ncbi:MAG TPA: SxtJ family membrane protein [Gemmatimonadaceae bacterium]|nr:SxtJ family membrane protein [Gemmatimonadaceae bacterium]
MTGHDPRRAASLKELRDFGLLVGGAFLVIATLLFFRHRPPTAIAIVGSVGALLAVTGLGAPSALRRVYAGWMRFALLLSKVTTPIFMGVIYFLVLTPAGFLLRAFGHRPLAHTGADTSWVDRPVDKRRSDLNRQF